jgi:hypothetical protein
MASPSQFRRLAATIWCRNIGYGRGIRTVAASFLVVTREPSSSGQTGNEDFASKILSEMRGRREEEVRGRTNQHDSFHLVLLTSFCCYLSSPIALFLFIRVSGTMCLNFSDFQCEESIDRVVWLWFAGCSGSSLRPTEILAHRPTAEVATSLSWPCEVWRPEQAILLHRPSHHVCVLHALLSPNLISLQASYCNAVPISWDSRSNLQLWYWFSLIPMHHPVVILLKDLHVTLIASET